MADKKKSAGNNKKPSAADTAREIGRQMGTCIADVGVGGKGKGGKAPPRKSK